MVELKKKGSNPQLVREEDCVLELIYTMALVNPYIHHYSAFVSNSVKL